MNTVITKEMKEHLLDSFIFKEGRFSSEEAEKLLSEDAVSFSKGDCVYSDKNFKKAIGIIVEGKVRVSTCDGKNGIILRDMTAGDAFGAAALFTEEKVYVSEIRAKTACTVVFISEEKMRQMFLKFPETAISYISFLSSKIRYLNARISELSAPDSESKLFDYMRKNVAKNGETLLPKNMSVLAKTLGIGRSSLYRALGSLEKKGFIEKSGDKWKIIKEKTKK